MSHFLEILTRDPIIARDGRPFGATQGHRMKSLEWLYPSVAAGVVRTLLGERIGGDFNRAAVDALKAVAVAGPLPMAASQLYFPVPQDLVVQQEKDKKRTAWAVRPDRLRDGEGTDLPSHILPGVLPRSVAEDFKPAKVPPFWSSERMAAWLLNPSGKDFEPPPDPTDVRPESLLKKGYLKIDKDERFHVKIDPATYAAMETQLFMTVALAMLDGVNISVRVESGTTFDSHLSGLDQWTTMGGERRLVHVSASEQEGAWGCPPQIREALAKTNLVRMVLATPALFKDGWKPGWIDGDGRGEFGGVKLRLVGACVERWRPISGWSYESPRGPKPALRLAPAGSVYFFETETTGASLAEQWLQPVSDFSEDGQSGRDGFGLALWGPWAPHSE